MRHAFTPPPRASIEDRITKLNELVATRTEKSALALRRLTGAVRPKTTEVGRPYSQAACWFDSLNLLLAEESSNSLQWWTRLQPIRTVAEVALEFAVFTHEPFVYQRIGDEARRMRKLGMTLQAIGKALGVDEKTVRKVVRRI